MDFSEPYPFAGPPPQFAPNGEYLAVVVEYRVLIQSIDWSPDSKYILCCLKDRAIIQIWSIDEPDWTCKINEGPAGISSARWCPDARSILLTADFQIKATIWSLVDRKCIYIKGPKFANKGIDFSEDGKSLLITERYDCKDYITIFSCENWKPKQHFRVETEDLGDAKWCPGDELIAVWDSLLYYKILLYSTSGNRLGHYSAYGDALGIKSVHWSPSGRFISVGSFDQTCRLLQMSTWSPFFTCLHDIETVEVDNAIVYREVVEEKYYYDEKEMHATSKYIVCNPLLDFPPNRIPAEKPDPKMGVELHCWSPSERFLATKNDECPWVVWIWNVQNCTLTSLMIQKHAVKFLEWEPDKDVLAVCCGTSKVYLWSFDNASVIHVPFPEFQVQRALWNKHKSNVTLLDNHAFCLGYLLDT